jgi:hypothetical protein
LSASVRDGHTSTHTPSLLHRSVSTVIWFIIDIFHASLP